MLKIVLIGENRFFEERPIAPKAVSKHGFIGLFHWGMGFCSNGAKPYPPTLSSALYPTGAGGGDAPRAVGPLPRADGPDAEVFLVYM